jgi:putative methyltransferase (TIGR04325 family)
MPRKMKQIIKAVLPPVLVELLRDKNRSNKFIGVYHDWAEARKKTSGYDNRQILDKVLSAAVKAENGEAVFERDSALLSQLEYSWPLLAALLLSAANNDGKINVLDFGGAMGTSYRQNKKFLERLKEVTWNIVEQEEVVAAGKKNIKEKNIKFWSSLEECLVRKPVDLAIFSASIQYVENPYEILRAIIKYKINYLVFDRLLVSGEEDFITIQNVPAWIYQASYPLWIMNAEKLKIFFRDNGYELLEEFADELDGNVKIGKLPAEHRGYIFAAIKKSL